MAVYWKLDIVGLCLEITVAVPAYGDVWRWTCSLRLVDDSPPANSFRSVFMLYLCFLKLVLKTCCWRPSETSIGPWHLMELGAIRRSSARSDTDVHGSVYHNTNHIEITNKTRPCSIIYYSNVSQLLNIFRATRHSSSGAQKL